MNENLSSHSFAKIIKSCCFKEHYKKQDVRFFDKRQRDQRIEENPGIARETINNLLKGVETLDLNQEVKFEGDFTTDGSKDNFTASSVGRELAYCIEHSIHHQAIIKAGLIDLGLSAIAGENFGVAYSTIRYRENQCAQ